MTATGCCLANLREVSRRRGSVREEMNNGESRRRGDCGRRGPNTWGKEVNGSDEGHQMTVEPDKWPVKCSPLPPP